MLQGANELLKVLAEHDDLDGIWCYGDAESCARPARAFRREISNRIGPTKDATSISALSAFRRVKGRWYLETAHQVKISGSLRE